MTDIGKFDLLASGLTMNEKQEFLQKLKKQLTRVPRVPAEVLYTADVPGDVEMTDQRFAQLSLFLRIWFILQSLLKAKSPTKAYEDSKLAKIRRRIERRTPGIYDFKRGKVLPDFYHQLEKLKRSARFFHNALHWGIDHDKGGFFAFLSSLEMEDDYMKILAVTDPAVLGDQLPEASVSELHEKSVQDLEYALDTINEETRKKMYFYSRSLFCLEKLSSFPFDKILKSFSQDPSFGGPCCFITVIKDLLIQLNNILFSIRQNLSLPLLEFLFVFMLQGEQMETDVDIASKIKKYKAKIELSLETIREFNKKIPLTAILRISSQDMSISPVEISGGEDWTPVYREYWNRQIDLNFAAFTKRRKEEALKNIFNVFLKGAIFIPLIGVASEERPEGVPLEGADVLAFLDAFYAVVFIPDMNPTLKTILIEGVFCEKKEGLEFAESYNVFFTLDYYIRKLEKDISSEGDLGQRYSKIKQQFTSSTVRRRKSEIILNDAASIALGIRNGTYKAAKNLFALLQRITLQKAKGDTVLVNLPELSAKDTLFMKNLINIVQNLQQFIQILDEIGWGTS